MLRFISSEFFLMSVVRYEKFRSLGATILPRWKSGTTAETSHAAMAGEAPSKGPVTSRLAKTKEILKNQEGNVIPKNFLQKSGEAAKESNSAYIYYLGGGGFRARAELYESLLPICTRVLERLEAREDELCASRWAREVTGSFKSYAYTPAVATEMVVETLISCAFLEKSEHVPLVLFHETLQESLDSPLALGGQLARLDPRLLAQLCRDLTEELIASASDEGLAVEISLRVPQYDPTEKFQRAKRCITFKLKGETVILNGMLLFSEEPALESPGLWKAHGGKGRAYQEYEVQGQVRLRPIAKLLSSQSHDLTFSADSVALKAINDIHQEPIVFSTIICDQLMEECMYPLWTQIAAVMDTRKMTYKTFQEKGLDKAFDEIVKQKLGCPGKRDDLEYLVDLRYNNIHCDDFIEPRSEHFRTTLGKMTLAKGLHQKFSETFRVLTLIKFYNNNPVYPKIKLDFRGRHYQVGSINVTRHKLARQCTYKQANAKLRLNQEGFNVLLAYVKSIAFSEDFEYPSEITCECGFVDFLKKLKNFKLWALDVKMELVRLEVSLNSGLPPTIQLDASASGLQMISLLLASLELMRICNLQDDPISRDPYPEIVPGFFQRAILKAVVMTTLFNSRPVAQAMRISNDNNYPWHVNLFKVKAIREAFENRVWCTNTSIRNLMDLMLAHGREFARVRWDNGLGITSVMGYRQPKPRYVHFAVEDKGGDRVRRQKTRIASEGGKPDLPKQSTAMMPNYCHFIDSSVMYHALGTLHEKGIHAVTIHDAFLVHPNHKNDVIRAYNGGLLHAQSMVSHNLPIKNELSEDTKKSLLNAKFSLQTLYWKTRNAWHVDY